MCEEDQPGDNTQDAEDARRPDGLESLVFMRASPSMVRSRVVPTVCALTKKAGDSSSKSLRRQLGHNIRGGDGAHLTEGT